MRSGIAVAPASSSIENAVIAGSGLGVAAGSPVFSSTKLFAVYPDAPWTPPDECSVLNSAPGAAMADAPVSTDAPATSASARPMFLMDAPSVLERARSYDQPDRGGPGLGGRARSPEAGRSQSPRVALPEPTIHRARGRWSRESTRSAPRPGGCVLSARCSSNPLRSPRSAFCERPHGRTGVGRGLSLPVLIESINSSFVVAPVVMWSGRRAVQGPGVGRRPSPGRHVHGRGGRGARGGASLALGAPGTGRARGSFGRAQGGGVLGACPVTWRETARVNPNRCGSSAQAVGPGRRTPSPRVGLPHNRTVHRDAGTVVRVVVD